MGAQMVKEVASQANDVAGDGTTTATVLAQAVTEGLKSVAAGMNPMDLKRGIDKAVKVAVTRSTTWLSPVQILRQLLRSVRFQRTQIQPSVRSLQTQWTKSAKTASSL